jgi:hypothetical protein
LIVIVIVVVQKKSIRSLFQMNVVESLGRLSEVGGNAGRKGERDGEICDQMAVVVRRTRQEKEGGQGREAEGNEIAFAEVALSRVEANYG